MKDFVGGKRGRERGKAPRGQDWEQEMQKPGDQLTHQGGRGAAGA